MDEQRAKRRAADAITGAPLEDAQAADDLWARLAAAFKMEAVVWQATEFDDDDQRVRLRPQLASAAVRARLDEVAQPQGWSNLFQPFGEAVICTLSVGGVSKSAVSAAPRLGPEARAEAALVLAAEGFGLRPPADQSARYWVEANAETGEPLYEPALSTPSVPPSESARADQATPEAAPEAAPAAETAAAPSQSAPAQGAKSEGQRAIDRLVERLKGEGKGGEVAKLIVEFSGYGGNPEQSRELYRRLRALLRPEPSS